MSTAPPSPPPSVDLARAYAGRRVLVAGADGFLGVNAALTLGAAGAEVTVLSRRDRPRARDARHTRADLADAAAVAAAVEGQDYVFDLAGAAGATGSNADPAGNIEAECRPHLNLFVAAARAASRPVVAFCSTRLVYGRPDRLPVGEDHPTRPASFYAVHKLTLEHYLQVLATTAGLRSVVLRLSNPYGPHWPEQRKGYGLINQFIARALAGEPIPLFGDGAQRRDYIHVDDFTTALIAVAAMPACHGQTFNVGGTEPISIRQAVEAIAAQVPGTVIDFRPWPADYLAVETGDYQTDLTKLHRHVRLPPQVSFAEGLRRTLAAVEVGLPVG